MEKKYGFQDTSFLAAGGEIGIAQLVNQFYEEMNRLPQAKTVRDMHEADLTEVKDKLTRFLCGWLGGPKRYHEKYGPISIPRSHASFTIGSSERDAWLLCMERAVNALGYDDTFKKYLMEQFAIPAERVRNQD